jgi:hypothetical protein
MNLGGLLILLGLICVIFATWPANLVCGVVFFVLGLDLAVRHRL